MPRILSFLLVTATLSFATAAVADVPGRVGRIALMQGDVQFYSEADPSWKVAYVNEPVTSRNSIFVGDAGRAEVTIGSTTLSMDAGTQVDIQQLDDDTFNANVVRGRVAMTVHRLDANDRYDVAVPGADFALLRPGRYRIDALDDASGITVFAGQAQVDAGGAPITLDQGNALQATRDPRAGDAPLQFVATRAVPVPLDDWVLAREARFRDSEQAARYVSPNMTGYEDLDANGQWSNEADLGPVWYPTTHVQEDWVPYRYGRWAYVEPWGYTWVDDAPWGFAPFHYGRWVQIGHRWGWSPGAYVARPVYAPALVGFYGGGGVSVAFSAGAGPAVGWYPLAPWQRYEPHYAHSVTYINRVNNITIVNPPPRWADRGDVRDWNRFHGGTVVPQAAFASQRSISRVAIAPPGEFAQRAAPIGVQALPHPLGVPGAVRPGPRPGEGIPRPAFRSPSEFASNPLDRPLGTGDAGRASPRNAGFQPDRARAPTQEARPVDAAQERARFEASRPSQGRPGDEGGRPANVVQPGVPAAAAVQRFAPRVGPEGRPDGARGDAQADALRQQQEAAARGADRQRTEFRNQQRPPEQAQRIEAERQQQALQRQAQEQQRQQQGQAIQQRQAQQMQETQQRQAQQMQEARERQVQQVQRQQVQVQQAQQQQAQQQQMQRQQAQMQEQRAAAERAPRAERPAPSPVVQQKLENAGVDRGGPGQGPGPGRDR